MEKPGNPAERRHPRGVTALFLAALVGAAIPPARAQTTGDNGSHDPSRMIESGGKLYVYSTGGGMKSSRDGLAWISGPAPTWNRALHPNNQGIWAPDIFLMEGRYFLYGSMWTEANKSSSMVLLTSPAIDPAAPGYQWTDQGIAVACPSGVTHSCIDPAPFLDQQGKAWLVWGGGYPFPNEATSIWLTPLDKSTGLPLKADAAYQPPNRPGHSLKLGHKEAPYIHFRSGYYYLWWQTGSCCSGTASTYTMHVARSAAVTGPYTGDRVFYASKRDQGINGPGHMGIYSCRGVDYFTYHYYPTNRSIVGLNTLTWGADGWPVAGPPVDKGISLPCAATSSLDGSGSPDRLRPRTRGGPGSLELWADREGFLEIAAPDGRVRHRARVGKGWNRIGETHLEAGVNLLRLGTSQGMRTAMVLRPEK